MKRSRTATAVTSLLVAGLVGLTGCQKPLVGAAPTQTSPPAAGQDAVSGSAGAALNRLPVRAAGTMSGYNRLAFGAAWTDDVDDVDGHNGCDTRDDILALYLTRITYRSGHCIVASGTLHDPYTGRTIDFVRGPKSTVIQIDHVVALGNAWTSGASRLTATLRKDLAEDPLELLPVDGPTNEAKGDGDASQWLPPQAGYHCSYVARQIAVKTKYHLSVTAPERSAMQHVLTTCPKQGLPVEPR
ncbi:HNH endonuclease family protein [Streptacidiphilus sp. N1-10]|uniref:HNH endonuclease family protein n=1 Tax=Streptacidiphilus jeojiensis TaxID=3229225 RepID=A0ABV6XEX3_9ACTN